MQRPSQQKRDAIFASAAKLFATKPYHQVRLGDVASDAGVGKGTLYVYFDSKEDLFFALIGEGFAALVHRLTEQLKQYQGPAMAGITTIVRELVDFAVQHPYLFEIMRSVGGSKLTATMDAQRAALSKLIEDVLHRGISQGELRDPNPELTALCIPGLVRSVFLFGPKGVDPARVTDQLVGLLERGLRGQVPA